MNKISKIILLIFFTTTLVYSNPLDTVFHPIQTAKKTVTHVAIAAGAVFVTKKVGEAVYQDFQMYMQEHPKEAQEYLKTKSEFADGFFRFIDKHRSGIDPGEFDKIDKEIRDKALEAQKRKYQPCSSQDLQKLLLAPNIFNDQINMLLPNIAKLDTGILSFGDVDSYYVATKKRGVTLERDHVPSYASITTFFNKNHIILTPQMLKNLKQNTSTIAIDTDIHKKTETYGGRNTQTRQTVDAQNLKLASIRDMVFSAAVSYKKYGVTGLTIYVRGAMTVYERNLLLCLYQ